MGSGDGFGPLPRGGRIPTVLVAGPFEQISEFPRSGYFGEFVVSSVSDSWNTLAR